MRVLSTQMGLVSSWVRAPAAREAAKKSAGVRSWEGGAERREGSPSGWVEERRMWAMACSRRDLKKKKEAQLVALPRRFGVRPR
jgi:hypothetical protein